MAERADALAQRRRNPAVFLNRSGRWLSFQGLLHGVGVGCDAVNGEHLGTEAFPNTHADRARAISWAGRRTGGDLGALWVIEGAGNYGAQIARQTAHAGYQVAEAARMGRASRRGMGRSDPIDARRIAAAVLRLPEEQPAAVNNGDVGRHPFRSAKLPALPSRAVDETLLPSGQQVQDIADEFRREWALSVWLTAGLGLRMGEMLGLRVGDVLDDRVRLRRQVTRVKGVRGAVLGPLKHRRKGDWRDIPSATNLSEAVGEHVARYGTGPDGTLFQTITGTLVTTSDYSSAFRKVVKTLGYDWSPHDLRHWFATTALSNGLPLLDVSRWLGHKSIKETADPCGHLTPDATGRAVKVMDVTLAGTVLTWC